MRWNTKRPLSELSLAGYDCYVFEEAQFLTGLYDLCRELLFVLRKNILVVGLDGCAQQKKFGEILDLIPICTNVTKLSALCKQCGDGTPAVYSKKMEEHGDSQVDVGGSEKYTAVCLRHL
jgi:thymidine kinase